MEAQDFDRAKPFWRELLKGFTRPTSIGLAPLSERTNLSEPDPLNGYGFMEQSIPHEAAEDLRRLAKEHALTLNTLVQGAWALLLHRYSSEDDVVFGATRACRRSVLSGHTENLLGPILNTLPVRIQVEGSARLIPWLKRLRHQWLEMRLYENTPLSSVAAWSSGQKLFRSFCDFNSGSLTPALQAFGPDQQKCGLELYQRTPYPWSRSSRPCPTCICGWILTGKPSMTRQHAAWLAISAPCCRKWLRTRPQTGRF